MRTCAPENVSCCSSPAVEPSTVYAATAPNVSTGKWMTPRPISSSGLNATFTGPCGTSGCAMRYAAAAMISAMPALSSAPSSVVPSVVISVVADVVRQLRRLCRADHLSGVAEHDVAALVADALRLDVRAAALARSVDVREERDAGTSWSTVAGIVAVT